MNEKREPGSSPRRLQLVVLSPEVADEADRGGRDGLLALDVLRDIPGRDHHHLELALLMGLEQHPLVRELHREPARNVREAHVRDDVLVPGVAHCHRQHQRLRRAERRRLEVEDVLLRGVVAAGDLAELR
jgi:hypothetical protein